MSLSSAAVRHAFALSLLPVLAAADTTTQLPRHTRPTHYDVEITPDAAALRFEGRVGIDLEVTAPTPTLTLNALELEVRGVRLDGTAASGVTTDATAQTATFSFPSPIAPGKHRLEIDYSGSIGTQAVGFFALYTQFEATDARRMLPCWDEPAYKATFTLAATVAADAMAVSNMPVRASTPAGDGRKRVEFAVSPRMSSYLLFFASGDFERATTRAGDTEIGVITQRGKVAQAGFALEGSAAVLREYNDYFGTPYPLPKLDNVAAPGRSQFFGAMENWGAIFTFEYALLVDPQITTASDRQALFTTAAHEIAHQWFGDLVTMSWWDDLWLNEGFASWMAGRTVEKLHPEWKPEVKAVKEREKAMERDALPTTHPVVRHVETVAQMSQAFDAITYKKGEAILRMLEGWVGAEAWRDGVRLYMKKHAYGNTVSDDLWHAVGEAGGAPVLDIAHQFTLQPGIPLITVADVVCRNGRTSATLVQGQFQADGESRTPLRWKVPVLVRTAGHDPVRVMVENGRAVLDVEGCGPLLVNAGQGGYFRTRYAPAQLRAIAESLSRLAAVDQLGIFTDTWALGQAGLQPLAGVLDLAVALPDDADPQVLGEMVATLGLLDQQMDGMPARREAFRAWATARLRPLLKRTGWVPAPGEPDVVGTLRNDLIDTLGALGDESVIAEARRRWDAQAADPTAVPGPVRKAVLGVVARQADLAAWERLLQAAREETTPLVRDQLYQKLATAEEPALMRRALDLALTDEPGATNTSTMIAEAAEVHPDLVFDFAIANLAQVESRVDATSRSRYYPRLALLSADPAMLGKLSAYAAQHLTPDARGEAEMALARIRQRIELREKRLPELDAWLAKPALQHRG